MNLADIYHELGDDYVNCSGCESRVNTHVHAAKIIKKRGSANFSNPITSPS